MALRKLVKSFPAVLADFMQREGLTGPKAAERLDVPHQSLYNWRNGVCLPTGRQAKRLAEAMGNPAVVAMVARARVRRAKARAGGAA